MGGQKPQAAPAGWVYRQAILLPDDKANKLQSLPR